MADPKINFTREVNYSILSSSVFWAKKLKFICIFFYPKKSHRGIMSHKFNSPSSSVLQKWPLNNGP